jgi:gliding motility-associated-like protein
MFKLRLFLLVGFLFSMNTGYSAAPNWSVNPSAFQFSMTVTAVANINCVELQNPSNLVAAFVGSTCRGVANTSTVINGRFIASMIVYSNLAQGENIILKIYNASNDSVYDATGTILFQDNASYGVTSSPFTVRNNNNPTDILLSNNTVVEGLPINTSIATISSLDPDTSDTFTYALVSGTGSTDNSNFNIIGNVLRTSIVMSSVQKPSHQIRIRTTDSRGCSFDKFFTINVSGVNSPPTQIVLSDSSINENMPANSVIGTLTAIDENIGETFVFTLVPGVGSIDNGSFNILGASLRTSQSFNYELKSAYSIRIRVTDSGNNTFERQVSISINDVNDPPTNILLNGNSTGASFAENRPIGSHIATLTTIDEDVADQHTYSFLNMQGSDNSLFIIVGNSLRTNALFDFEARQNYVVFVQTNDGKGGTFNKQFSLMVTDSNDAPTDISISSQSVEENKPAGTYVGKLITTDPDINDVNFVYSFVSGQGSGGNSQFFIRNDSLFTNAIFDFEVVSSYSIRLNTSDGNGGNFQKVFTISIIDVNDPPTDINISSNQIPENRPSNTVIGQLSTIDQDAGNTFIYTLVPGVGATDNNSFNISGNNLRSSIPFDYETKNTYSIRIRTTDNAGGTFEKQFTIQVTDEIDSPTDVRISDSSVYENMPINTVIGLLSSINQDSVPHTYSFSNVSGNDNSLFTIIGNQLRTNSVFDFESRNLYTIYITSTAAPGASLTKLFQIYIKDTNDTPVDISLSSKSITENRPIGSYIGKFSTTDPDSWDAHTYQLATGAGANGNGNFFIQNDTLFAATLLDFETQNTYSVRVRTTDLGGLFFEKIFTITVNDSNDVPTGITLTSTSVSENQPIGTAIATLNSVDADANQTHTYSLVAGPGSTDNPLFRIVGNQLRTNMIFNFEQKNLYSIRLQTNDGNGGIFSDSFAITILDANDAPTNILLSNNTVVENSNFGTTIGKFSTIDEDTSDNHTYTLANVPGNENQFFFIFNDELKTNALFDFETKKIYTVFVQSSDGQASIIRQFLINVLDSNDAPSNILLTNQSIEENLPSLTFISRLFTQDEDLSDIHTYSLVPGIGSNDNSNFVIVGDSLLSNTSFNFEAKNLFSIRIRSTDIGGLFLEKQFNVNILDVNDAPSDIVLSSNEITENRPTRSLIGSFTSVDEDQGDKFTYALVSGIGATDNNLFIIQGNELRSNRVFNYEDKQQFSIRVATNDGRGGVFEKEFKINILDTNDAPTNIVLVNNAVAENAPIGRLITLITTIDQDSNDQHVYDFVNISGNNNDKFMIVGDQLRTAEMFNYEVKNFYVLYIRSTDLGGASIIRQFIIDIIDSVDAPTNIDISNISIAENQPIGSLVGTLTSVDEDQLDGFVYTLVSGAGSTDNLSFFTINDSLLSSIIFDYETKSNYSIRIRSTDATNAFFEKQFNIQVLDANDAPTSISMTNQSFKENEPVRTFVGDFNTEDVDAGDLHRYRLVSGTGDDDNALFIIEDNKLLTRFSADYEQKNTYSIRVSSTDLGGEFIEASFTISVIDVPEKPIMLNQTFSVREDARRGDVVGTLVSLSPDVNANLKYYFVDDIFEPFEIDNNTGDLKVSARLDYRKARRYVYKIFVVDEQTIPTYDTATLTINIIEVIKPNAPLPVNNFLSPNGDGINDFFEIENIELYKDYSLVIYNELGMEVFRVATNYQNNWDATFNGRSLSNGTYFYVLYNPVTNDEFKGSINLYR